MAIATTAPHHASRGCESLSARRMSTGGRTTMPENRINQNCFRQSGRVLVCRVAEVLGVLRRSLSVQAKGMHLESGHSAEMPIVAQAFGLHVQAKGLLYKGASQWHGVLE